jgi:signal-transduction protein with cAMP-binding, CBS, and nucleotidyltransferase domain
MHSKTYESGEIILSPGEQTKDLVLLQDGVIEVSTSFEHHDFVLDRLYRGSVLNFRTFFVGDPV